ncbi:transglutaminase-like domain-containing protein [Phreatobacter sp.]|uniref:transglutaminase-like domain-containing protein n=1 Tax=Phreatobacter sp. TaxID=1966341 RepID=UPI003F722296
MIVQVSAALEYEFFGSTQVVLEIQPATSPDQVIREESLTLPDVPWRSDVAPSGRRRLRGVVSGRVSLGYTGTIDNGSRALLPASGRMEAWSDLPDDVMPYLLPSRFCPSDSLSRFANRTFAEAGDGVARVMAVMDWIAEHVDYVPGASVAQTGADETFTTRAGVCRDFTHLAIALCRALNIPARAASVYALDLDPPDFHAVTEVYVGGAWWMVDPTRLAPVEGMVRIAEDRDAADIAFMTTDRPCTVISQTITVSRA